MAYICYGSETQDNFYASPKSRRMRCAGHVARMTWEMRAEFWSGNLMGRDIGVDERISIKMDLGGNRLGRCGLDSSGSG